MLDVAFASPAEKFLRKTDTVLAGRITERVEDLRNIPFPHKCRRVVGTPHYRVSVGAYRIIYRVDRSDNLLTILDVEKRNNIF